ncbi:hypothetical protein C1H46_031101 [Malus baccata]|uniref:Uncharacterized protein n=1 Tax=Malus baccata TaxID=106549 RepID=A0A540L9Z7_MALBA|nr:hypothetical protein C1H46_031101 [Malus baccata]
MQSGGRGDGDEIVVLKMAQQGIPIMLRAQSSHPLEPLSAAKISMAVATVRAARATHELDFRPYLDSNSAGVALYLGSPRTKAPLSFTM